MDREKGEGERGLKDRKERIGANIQRQQFALNFQCADFLPSSLDDIHAFATLDEVHWPTSPVATHGALACTLDKTSCSDIAGTEPGTTPVVTLDETLPRGFLIAPVLAEDGRATKLNLTDAFTAMGIDLFASGYDLIRLGVHETSFNLGQRPANAAIDAVCKVEATTECHADLGHAEALEEHVAITEGLPGGFCRGRESRRAGDVEAKVLRGNAFLSGLLDVGGERRKGGAETIVDGGNGCKESDFFLGRIWRGGRLREKRCCEAIPDVVGVEGVHEFNRGAGEERRDNGVDHAVDVMQRK